MTIKKTSMLTLPPSLQQISTPKIFKVAVLGAESTGKTTLCQDLAKHYNTQYVGEYMRDYLQIKWNATQTSCEWRDLMPIAIGQVAVENKLAQLANNYLFCDTSLFELMVYSYWYYNDCPPLIKTAALSHHYDLIVLTEVDVPWEADDLRDAPHQRHEISQAFEDFLREYYKPFMRIGGSREARVLKISRRLKEMNQPD